MPAVSKTPIWHPAKLTAGGSLKFLGFGSPSENTGGVLVPARFSFEQSGQTVETQTLCIRLADTKAFGVSVSNMTPDKYSGGFILTQEGGVTPLLELIMEKVRTALLGDFAALMTNRAASIMAALSDDYKKQIAKAKGAAKTKLVKELHQKLSAAERSKFEAQAGAALDDCLRVYKQGDGRGGLLSPSSKSESEFIINCDVYPERAKGGAGPKVSFHDEQHTNPKLELKVNQDGVRLQPEDTFPAVSKDSVPAFQCSAAVIEMKKVFIKSDCSMVSVGFHVTQINKSSGDDEEEFDLDAVEPTAKRPRVEDQVKRESVGADDLEAGELADYREDSPVLF